MLKPNISTRFNGEDYQPMRDDNRLTGQLLRVWQAMQGGLWRTLAQIAILTGDPQASVSAQLRHLRKARFGAHAVEKEYLGHGLYQYRVTPGNPGLVR